MVKLTFRGLMAPVFTVFDADGSVNTKLIPIYADSLAKSGIKAILAQGTSGEGMSMTVAERKKLSESWASAVITTKQHLMVQVGGCPLPDVLDLARHAEKIGADSLLCLPELYFRPSTVSELVAYLKLVGEAAPSLPVLYYHIPAWTGVNINMAQFIEAAGKEIPNFGGIKYTSNDLDMGYSALRAANGKYGVFLGADTLMASSFILGFDSVIATTLNFLPEYAVKIQNSVKNSDLNEARRVQEKLNDICKAITKHGAWVPTMKAANDLVSHVKVGTVRPPLVEVTACQIDEMKRSFNTLKLSEC